MSLGAARDVDNTTTSFDDRLVPNDVPDGGLACAYHGSGLSTGQGVDPQLTAKATILPPTARRLGAALRRVSLKAPHGETSCPADLPGSVTIVVLSYAKQPDLDLWYKTSGCQTIDNGNVGAYEIGNPSFYAGLVPILDALTGVAGQ